MFSELPDLGHRCLCRHREPRLQLPRRAAHRRHPGGHRRRLHPQSARGDDQGPRTVASSRGSIRSAPRSGISTTARASRRRPDPEKAPLIREMFELYASGQHSLRSLRQEMNRRGLRNHAGRPLSLCGIETIINNPFYTGLIVIQTHRPDLRGHPRADRAGRRCSSASRTSKQAAAARSVTRHNHLYRGLFRCGLCDGPMSPELPEGPGLLPLPDTDCATKTDPRRSARGRSSSTRSDGWKSRLSKPTELRKAWADEPRERKHRPPSGRRFACRLLAEEQRLDRLTDLLIDGAIDEKPFDTENRSSRSICRISREELRSTARSGASRAQTACSSSNS